MTNILIVDDDADILEILRLEFEDDPGCSADTATGVLPALTLAAKNAYDVIITDWRMPEKNGTEFVRALRHQGCTSRVIIYSGKEHDRDIDDALAAGADYFIGRRGDPQTEFAGLKQILVQNAAPEKNRARKSRK